MERYTELNRFIYENPRHILTWFEIIDIQASVVPFSSITTPIIHINQLKFPVLCKQLEVTEKALSKNLSCLPLKFLRLHLAELAATLNTDGKPDTSAKLPVLSSPLPSSLMQSDNLLSNWAQLAFTHPQVVGVWRGYLAYLRRRIWPNSSLDLSSSLFYRVDAAYKRAIGTLSGILSGRLLSHKPEEDTAEQSLGMLFNCR
ncbi:unnamed protein product [Protopolystoma xenopodis]|uniref:Uncharacterized protein n=1 Tax=Protopolystoma xenopodis TaxID=117903 RepID=A0A448X4Y2_9PLAT|nr:unnamed protein product [Protopolystoma xenopodis]